MNARSKMKSVRDVLASAERGSSMPSRVSASSAFFFQSARRNRCAAIVYQFPGLVVMFGLFFDGAEFPRHHCVARALEQFGKFCLRFRAVFRLADARLYLPPICHVGAL